MSLNCLEREYIMSVITGAFKVIVVEPKKTTLSGSSFVKVRLVCDSGRPDSASEYKNKKLPLWASMTIWERDGVLPGIVPYLKKGSVVEVTGIPNINVYVRKDGVPAGELEIWNPQIKFIPKDTSEGGTHEDAPSHVSGEEDVDPFAEEA